jgi:uncharacterized membrane protein YphA (DoxX/SURF4 family)
MTQAGWLNIALWVAQILLFLMFGSAGYLKVFMPMDALAGMMSYTADYPEWFTRMIGVFELLGAAGIILPALTRIVPVLTPLAALGFAAIQVLAIGLHAMRGETAMTLPINLVLLALAVFVVWGRWKAAPIIARG